MRRFPSDTLPSPQEQLLLEPEVSHHVLRVTLLPRGSQLVLFDGQGQSCVVELIGAEDGQALVQGLDPIVQSPPEPEIHLILGLPRKPALERILRMATELGMTDFHPFIARRSVAKGDKVDRWMKLVEQAARQSGRDAVPTLHPLQPLQAHIDQLPSEDMLKLVLQPGAPTERPAPQSLALLIGPEGGLDPSELDLAGARGFSPMGLGRNVLRSDTAALAALARLSF